MQDRIEKFWRYFVERRSDLEKLTTANDPVHDEVLAALHLVDPGLYFELCSESGLNEFILTADGDAQLFPLVENVVSHAPRIDSWEIVALKPKRGFPETTQWERATIQIADVMVRPEFRKDTATLGLHLYVDGLDETNATEIHNGLLRAIDSGVGERRFAENVESTWVHPMSALLDRPDLFRLPQLDAYLDEQSDRQPDCT